MIVFGKKDHYRHRDYKRAAHRYGMPHTPQGTKENENIVVGCGICTYLVYCQNEAVIARNKCIEN